jgi:hypothetical protein
MFGRRRGTVPTDRLAGDSLGFLFDASSEDVHAMLEVRWLSSSATRREQTPLN